MSWCLSWLYEPFHGFYDLLCCCISLPCTRTVLVFVLDKLLHIGRFACWVCTSVQNLCVRWRDLWLYITLKLAKAAAEPNKDASGERPNKNKALLDYWRTTCIVFLQQIDRTSAKYIIKSCLKSPKTAVFKLISASFMCQRRCVRFHIYIRWVMCNEFVFYLVILNMYRIILQVQQKLKIPLHLIEPLDLDHKMIFRHCTPFRINLWFQFMIKQLV